MFPFIDIFSYFLIAVPYAPAFRDLFQIKSTGLFIHLLIVSPDAHLNRWIKSQTATP